jgi:uncharacterized metal-binding protein
MLSLYKIGGIIILLYLTIIILILSILIISLVKIFKNKFFQKYDLIKKMI